MTRIRRTCRAVPSLASAFRQYQWTSRVPGMEAVTGHLGLFHDQRIHWLMDRVRVRDLHCLDLGALEGGHGHMLLQAGARHVDAVEADLDNVAKMLLVNELMRPGWAVSPLLGDAAQASGRYDLVLACGILYHLTEPELALRRWCELAPVLYLWTHYWDGQDERLTPHGDGSAVWRYGEPSHLDGTAGYSVWLARDKILSVLEDMGMTCEIRPETPHSHGPTLELIARRGTCEH